MEKGTFRTRRQAMMACTISEGVISEEQRFGAHENKRKGITDTPPPTTNSTPAATNPRG